MGSLAMETNSGQPKLDDPFWDTVANGCDTSPYRTFGIDEWAALRADIRPTLSSAEVERLRSLGDPIEITEASRVYLTLSRLLSMHVEAAQDLFARRRRMLALEGEKTPFVIAVAGSVAVGKSTTARLLQTLLTRWPSSPKVALVTTDGFLHPNAVLEERGIMARKGFPESYDRQMLLKFLSDVKAGLSGVDAPVYSHLSYDVSNDLSVTVDHPDILIFEGLNVLQTAGGATPLASDFFDFSIYVDAATTDIKRWYIARFMKLRETAFANPESFFHRHTKLSEPEALETANNLWETINAVNLTENILPTRGRANVVLRKGADHLVERVALRRL